MKLFLVIVQLSGQFYSFLAMMYRMRYTLNNSNHHRLKLSRVSLWCPRLSNMAVLANLAMLQAIDAQPWPMFLPALLNVLMLAVVSAMHSRLPGSGRNTVSR